MDTQNITPLTPQKDRQVSGWLSFFLFVVGLGAAITVVTSIADFSLDAYDIGVGDFFIYLVALIDIVYVLVDGDGSQMVLFDMACVFLPDLDAGE